MNFNGWPPSERAFQCPLCGGFSFQTNTIDGVEWGKCKGIFRGHGVYDGCKFVWNRSDDAKVFREPGDPGRST